MSRRHLTQMVDVTPDIYLSTILYQALIRLQSLRAERTQVEEQTMVIAEQMLAALKKEPK